MPTERFYRLPREKAEAIRTAALKEFKRVPLEEASINRIIRDADISRGSFYTYFEDKKEVLSWLMNDAVKEMKRFYVKVMSENGGDIWDLFERMLDAQLDMCVRDGLAEVLTNVMKSNAMAETFQLQHACGEAAEEANEYLARWLYQRCDKGKCSLDGKKFRDLLELQMLALMLAMKQYFKDGLPREQVKETYLSRLDMIHYGVCPEEKNKVRKERQEQTEYE